MTTEIWKSIPGYPGYEVSDQGRVKSLKKDTPHILRPATYCGYLGVNLFIDGNAIYKRIHNLVMLAFVGLRPEGMEVCHNNGIHSDNRLDNLRYDTHAANMKDASLNGRGPLSREQVIEIRRRFLAGTSRQELAQEYNCSPSTISHIKSGLIYRHIEGATNDVYVFQRNRARNIREEYASGNVSYTQIAEKYNVTISLISLIVNGKRCLEAGCPIKGIDY